MILTGLARLGADAEVRYTPGGDPVANLSLAWNYGRRNGEGKRPSQWISASLWGDRATALQQYLTKGTALDVVLEDVHVETYDRRDGNGQGFRLAGRIVLLEFAGGRRDDQKPPEKPAGPPRQAAPTSPGDFSDFDDDIPF